ncbi:MAG: Phosphatidylcholine synthase [Firmicutes bacterium ADurb.Bin373]|nr:CDP-diacylglycerol--serine O-phosphatidyltransferase [Bacillota bacterium]OQA06793.1 MAG: Phosphatidylcholine synthase [Firmicutes bacterium ADurb.Bin373]
MLPNLCTYSNLLFGVLAIAAVFNHNFTLGAVFIILAAILDRFDGLLARHYNAASAFGRELDSLADLVSFGVAPSIMLYASMTEKWSCAGLACFAFFTLCGAYRLARYNISGSAGYFQGLPITIGGAILAALVALFHNPAVNVISSIVIALAMISAIRIPKI